MNQKLSISNKCYTLIAVTALTAFALLANAEEGRIGNGRYEISWTTRDPAYGEKIQELYETESAKKALTVHINNLLRFYAFNDDRIVATNRFSTPSQHNVFVSGEGEIVSLNKFGYGNKNPYREDRFSVFGVNHFVQHECSHSSGNCWVIHPVTKQRWLQIVENEDVAIELSRALSQLIRELQSPS